MTDPNEKGTALERAVRAIETTILKSRGLEEGESPGENTFVIEERKRIREDGVGHEIDIWVDASFGDGYEARFIFECKNWEDKVGKNEIVLFEDKVDVASAQKGFFVAQSFTSDAKARARKNDRIDLMNVREHPSGETPIQPGFHYFIREQLDVNVSLVQRGADTEGEPERLPVDELNVVYRGEQIDIDSRAEAWAQDVADDLAKSFPSNEKPNGTYTLSTTREKEFTEEEFIVNGEDFERLLLDVELTARVHWPVVVAHYEVESRGRILRLEPLETEDGEVELAIINIPGGDE